MVQFCTMKQQTQECNSNNSQLILTTSLHTVWRMSEIYNMHLTTLTIVKFEHMPVSLEHIIVLKTYFINRFTTNKWSFDFWNYLSDSNHDFMLGHKCQIA